MPYRVMRPDDELEWITRPHEPGEPARHVAELSERGHEETFVVLAGTLSIYLGDPPAEHERAELLDSAL